MHDIRPFLPELFSEPGTLLYIGARVDAHSWLEELIQAGHEISVLEIWHQNALSLTEWANKSKLKINVHIGDVRYITGPLNYLPFENFDYIFWWHGPEHLAQDEILSTLQNLESKTNKIIALACPWGWYPQGAHEGNPYEEHKTTLYPEFFELLGYQVKTDGVADKAGSEIVAWKRLQSRILEI